MEVGPLPIVEPPRVETDVFGVPDRSIEESEAGVLSGALWVGSLMVGLGKDLCSDMSVITMGSGSPCGGGGGVDESVGLRSAIATNVDGSPLGRGQE